MNEKKSEFSFSVIDLNMKNNLFKISMFELINAELKLIDNVDSSSIISPE